MIPKKLSLFPLVLLIIAAIDSIRNLPASAVFGTSSVFFFLFAAIIFLVPISLVSAELSSLFPEKGGVYHWLHMAFGKRLGMLGIWLQWIIAMVWYPTILSSVAGTAAYLIDPQLAHHKGFLIGAILCIFWGLTIINLFGFRVSAKITNICTFAGAMIPMALLVGLGVIWIFHGQPMQITMTAKSFIPALGEPSSWISMLAIMACFLGVELSGVHVNDIKEPQRNFPKAILMAGFFVLITMLFGSLVIASIVPSRDIHLAAGVIQVFTSFFATYKMEWCVPILIFLLIAGGVGSMVNWLISPAKGLLHAAEFGFIPSYFSTKNKYNVPSKIFIAQAIVVSLFSLAFLLIPNINAFYWFLTALSTELYMVLYILIFTAALRLHYKYTDRPKAFKTPGKHVGIWIACGLGLLGCMATLVIGFFPPLHIQVENHFAYALTIGLGNLLLISTILVFYAYKYLKKEQKEEELNS